MNKRFLPILLLAACLPLSAGNSIFSYSGYPVQFYGKDIYSLGMGDTGASDIFRNNTGYANPAQKNISNRTLFSSGLLLGYTNYRSLDPGGKKHSYLDNSLDLPYFSLSIPVRNHRLGFQINSYASGVVENQRSFTSDTGLDILEQQQMDRYLYRADLIYSLNLGDYYLGVSGNYYFGHEIRTITQDAGFGLFNTREQIERDYKNPSVSAGILRRWPKLALGAHYTMARTLSGEETRTSIHEQEPALDYAYSLPHHFSASLTALPAKELKVAADLHYELWQEIDPALYGNGWKLGLGLAFEPTRDNLAKPFTRLPLRGGISYRRLPFEENSQPINELALSCGISFPLLGDVNRIDVGFQYTNRGKLQENRLADDSFLLMFGFTGFDVISRASDRRAPREIPVKEDSGAW